jgi:hypothetical protein
MIPVPELQTAIEACISLFCYQHPIKHGAESHWVDRLVQQMEAAGSSFLQCPRLVSPLMRVTAGRVPRGL